MTGWYRCSLGHDTPGSDRGTAPSVCPVCGDTAFLPSTPPSSERGSAAVATAELATGEENVPTPPSSGVAQTVTFPPTPRPPRPTDTPSFSSLVGMPGDDPDATRYDHGSIVPFGADTVDAIPAPSVPGYVIIQEVGRGGMGVVYKARQVSLNRIVALKMILAGIHAGPTERERFRREAEAVATLQNQHIVQIFEIGEAGGHLYLALEFVEGGSLAQHLTKHRWGARDAAELIALLAHAVHYAHQQGVVHRDLKPGNVLLAGIGGESDGADAPRPARPKITDFGLAKRLGDAGPGDGTKTGAVMGTPSYIAPEQASGKAKEVGPAADVYALGAILYELLTGRPPFMGETPLDTVLQVLKDDPVPPKRLVPTLPRDLETICLKCLAKSPASRYATAAALAEDLNRFLAGEPIRARPLSAWGRAVKWSRRHPALAILTGMTIAATVALVTVLSVAYARVSDAVAQKEREATAAREAGAREVIARREAEELTAKIEKLLREAVETNENLRVQGERTRRLALALQLAQIAAMCERDPTRARAILDDEARCPEDLRDFTWAYLRRLCEREERVYTEHGVDDRLHAVAYSPTGAFVATAGTAGDVRLWDPRTGRTWAVLVGNTRRVTGIAFSSDGGAVATAGADGSVRLWALPLAMLDDARRTVNLIPFLQPVVRAVYLRPAMTLAAHTSEANCVAFSPDGRYLVSGGGDGFIKRWDLRGWRPAIPHIAAAGGPLAVAATVAHASGSPNARPVWIDRELAAAHRGGVKCVAFAADGDVLVSGGADGAACVWAGDGSRLIRTFDDHADAVTAVAINAGGRLLATVNNGPSPTVRLFNLDTGRERRLIGHTGTIYSLAMSAEGELLASAGFDRSIRLWDLNDAQERSVLLGHELAVSGLAFAHDRRTVVSVSLDATARVWQTSARPSEEREAFREQTLLSAAVSATGVLFVGGDEDGRVRVYRSDLFQNRLDAPPAQNPFFLIPVLNTRLPGGRVRAVASSADGQTAVASTDEGVFLWRVIRLPGGRLGGAGFGGLPGSLPVALKMPRPVYAMTIDPSGEWLVTLDEEGVRLWDLQAVLARHADGEPQKPQGPGLIHAARFPQDLAMSRDGTLIAVAVGNGIRVIDLTGKVVAELPTAHLREIRAVAFGKDDRGAIIATADTSGQVNTWRLGKGPELVAAATLHGHTAEVTSLAFTRDGKTLASAGYDRSIILSDPLTGQERAALTGHADRIQRVQFVPDMSALMSVGRDGTVKRWRAAGGAQPVTPDLSAPRGPRPRGKLGR